MRVVTFDWGRRLEMAVAWAFPISLLGALLVLPFWRQAVLPLLAMVWSLSLLLFLGFPLYEQGLETSQKSVGFVFFDFGPRAASLVLWLVCCLVVASIALATGASPWTLVSKWGGIAFVVLAILGLDLMGSTPHYKSGLHEDRRLRIALDEERCKGAAFCADVCPVDVFEIDRDQRLARLPRASACVQCGACIVQCPFDALHFRQTDGGVIEPETIRRYKLNLVGKRVVRTAGGRGSEEEPS